MPADHGIRLDDDERVCPGGELILQCGPEGPVEVVEPGPGVLALYDGELLTESHVFKSQIGLVSEESSDEREELVHDVEQNPAAHRFAPWANAGYTMP